MKEKTKKKLARYYFILTRARFFYFKEFMKKGKKFTPRQVFLNWRVIIYDNSAPAFDSEEFMTESNSNTYTEACML